MRKEYPRPQIKRDKWLSLNGEWQFDIDENNSGLKNGWYQIDREFNNKINVPFCPESKLSGIEMNKAENYFWYKKNFIIPEDWHDDIYLNFGAVDYACLIFINGIFLEKHIGGHSSFSINITPALTDGWNEGEIQQVTVYCYDPARDDTIARGKQNITDKNNFIYYTRTSGIWQPVWIEPLNKNHLSNLKMTPDIDTGQINIEFDISNVEKDKIKYGNYMVHIEIMFESEKIITSEDIIRKSHFNSKFEVFGDDNRTRLSFGGMRCWWPETPNLYDLKISLYKNDIKIDEIISYFGMRKIHIEDGRIYLNNRPYYLKLILDQGYWPDGLMTAPTDESFIKDITMAKKMGFNGCRKHQKIEDPRFYYYADKLGYLVFSEMPSYGAYSDEGAKLFEREWFDVIKKHYNHPSIIAWVPFNESWGISEVKTNKYQQAHTESVYYGTKSYDQTRPIINNDGWYHTKTDIIGIHNYQIGDIEKFSESKKSKFYHELFNDLDLLLSAKHSGRDLFADGYKYEKQPIIMSEVGGIAYKNEVDKTWGYTNANDESSFLDQFKFIIECIYSSRYLSGFCYTQLSDVEQETNGLLTYDREYKINPKAIKAILDRWNSQESILFDLQNNLNFS